MDTPETIISVIIGIALFCTGFGICYTFNPVWHEIIAGEAFLTYTGNAEIRTIDIVTSSQLETTFNILQANNYSIQITINQDEYEQWQSWDIGIHTLRFNVTFPNPPFDIKIKVLEVE